MSQPVDSKAYDDAPKAEAEGPVSQVEHADTLDEKANFRADAIEAENAEHNMGVLEAARAYPMASLWAFVMSCTIVSWALFSFPLPRFPPTRTPS